MSERKRYRNVMAAHSLATARKNDVVLNVLVMCTVVVVIWALHSIVYELAHSVH